MGGWQILSNLYREDEKELRQRLRQTVKETFPDQAAKFSQTIGLFPFEADPEVSGEGTAGRTPVVLIHGLDDPGKVWQNLAPALTQEGLKVWLMQYPNDQPIAESALLFYAELKELKQRGIDRIAIVAHSMGGLVSREMLTRPDLDFSGSAKKGLVPEVTMLIMVGTPNHGSQMVRFRIFAEVRDHVARLAKGEANWLGAILDGAGEAKIDLMPESRFLTALNRRPHPKGVDMYIIAGITSPWSEKDITEWLDKLRPGLAEEQRMRIDALGQHMISMTHAVGDGLVTVESTRLPGIPHYTVNGTHLSMIRNITRDSRRVPPAVPIIIDRLKKTEAAVKSPPASSKRA